MFAARFKREIAISIFGALLFSSGIPELPGYAQQTTRRGQVWPELDAYVRLNPKSRLLFAYASTRDEDTSDRLTWRAGGFVDFYFRRLFDLKDRQHPDSARNRMLMFRAGYLYSPTPAGAALPATQHIPTILADTRFSLPWQSVLAERNRFDLRIINGDFTPRYRNRVTIERPFKTGQFEFAPYVQGEASYDWKYDTFNRLRFSTGVDWTAARFLVLETYYTRQRDTRSTVEYVDALGVTLQLHLR